MGYDFKIEKATVKKEKPADQGLGFGRYFTDHMFLMNYNEEKVGTMAELFLMVHFHLNHLLWFSTMHKSFLKVLKHTELKTAKFNFSVHRKTLKE